MILNPYRFGPPGFSPDQLTGIQNWWDIYNLGASDGATVTSVSDIVGTEDLTSTTGPIYRTSDRALEFTGSGNNFLTADLTSVPLSGTYSIVMIMRLDGVPTTTDAIWSNEVAYGAGDISLRGRGGGQYAGRMYFNNSNSGGSITMGLSTWVMVTSIMSATGWEVYVNTTLSQSNSDASIDINNLLIGEDTGSVTSVTPNMTVGDIITIQSDVSTNGTELTDLFNYYQPLYSL